MKTFVQASKQKGVMLLEALISILIFSIGILAIVGLQANAIKLAGDAKYRSDANLLANQLIGQMWMAHSSPTFATDFRSPGGAQYQAWRSSVLNALPSTGASAPSVIITASNVAAASTVTSVVTINLFWTIPGEGSHQYSTQTQINN